ncbi:MAG: class I SAM-dependent DNA methyltransferase [Isosphaeraceae bacterium]
MNVGPVANGQRNRLVAEALTYVGYGTEHVEANWKYSNFDLLRKWIQDDNPDHYPIGETPSRLDIAAFYDGREHNWNTISLAAQLNQAELVDDKDRGLQEARKIFSDTAAPCVLFAGNGKADLWLRCWEQPTAVPNIDFDPQQLRKAFEHNRRELERDALAALRGGQRYLFDGFHLARREELANFLNRGITKATWLCQKANKPLDADSGKALSRVAIGLLAARILEDKGILGSPDNQSSDARNLLSDANSLADGFFRDVIADDLTKLDAGLDSKFVDEMLLRIMAHLTGPASFSMVTPEMLGDLYENALRAERKRGADLELDGIHYTPLSLTKRVLSRIPLEELPPSQRHVLDIACGSGTFLLAATERLRSTFDANEEDAEANVLDHLRSHVIGYDQDDVALHVANLTYLLDHVIETRDATTVPHPVLRKGDALSLTADNFVAHPPSIIVGNPPFGKADDGDQLANKFLSKALELLAPGGFLGMVMPGAFLKMMARGGVVPTRQKLLELCELLEIWEMPLGTIGISARQETCVIIARKRKDIGDSNSNAVLFNVTYSSNREAVRAQREHLRSTWTFMATGLPGLPSVRWTEDPTFRIAASPIDHVWQKLVSGQVVESFCDQTQGIETSSSATSFSSTPQPNYFPYLRTQKRLWPYFVLESDWRNDPDPEHDYVNPDTASEPRKYSRPLLHGPKLIVTSNTNRNARSQLRVAFDDAGVFPGHNFKCLGLHADRAKMTDWAGQLVSQVGDKSVLLWIAAIMNSPVAHAWIATYSPPRSTAIRVFMTLPVPAVYDPVIAKLVEATGAVGRQSDDFALLTSKINETVLSSYGLSAGEALDIQRYLDSLIDPWAESLADAHIPKRGKYRRISGAVVSLDVRSQKATLDLPRYSRGAGGPVILPLPREMPGWALREGIEFTCAVPVECRSVEELRGDPWLLRDFLPVPYSYLDESGLEEMLGYEKLGPAH